MKQNIKNTKLNVELTKEIINENFISAKINSRGREDKDDAFFIADLSDIVRKHKTWLKELPRVEPFYAVKCNDDTGVLSVLADLGTGFDCVTKAEISKVMGLDVSSNRVIFANTWKQNSHIRFAAKQDVSLMTFDNISELHKVKANHPNAKLVVKILTPEAKASRDLGMKFGAQPRDVPKLLKTAKDLGLNVVGVSFHLGIACYESGAFPAAVASARAVFDMGEQAGFHFDLLDIGGGFPGHKSAEVSFEKICGPLRSALDIYFPESKDVRIIAEPGRFFVASAFTLAVNIIAKRAIVGDEVSDDCESNGRGVEPRFMYYVNDGVYGSFNCLLFKVVDPKTEFLCPENYVEKPKFTSSIWGPTCDGIDCVKEETLLPEMNIGEWLFFQDMGAYSLCAATQFNAMPRTHSFYVMQESAWIHLEDPLNDIDLCSLGFPNSPKADIADLPLPPFERCSIGQ
eukprot:GHVO01058218.1.p1 GENE.GHVO01058218.1~~GHVO01058218.1.p1  ORF type:complete len:458 (+),score=52.03 GHVO01058218.1:250-1623(+)